MSGEGHPAVWRQCPAENDSINNRSRHRPNTSSLVGIQWGRFVAEGSEKAFHASFFLLLIFYQNSLLFSSFVFSSLSLYIHIYIYMISF